MLDFTPKQKLVVIGNGMAGIRTIEHLLERAPDLYQITVFGSEPHVNYNRILLSPVLAGEKTLEEIVLNPPSWYEEHGVKLRKGETIEMIDRRTREVVTATGERVKVLQDREQRHKRRSDALRQAVFAAMDAMQMASFKDPEFTASISAGRASAIVTDEAEVPDEYWKVSRAVDKAAINEATKLGVVIPGVILTNGVGSLTIRQK